MLGVLSFGENWQSIKDWSSPRQFIFLRIKNVKSNFDASLFIDIQVARQINWLSSIYFSLSINVGANVSCCNYLPLNTGSDALKIRIH